MRHQKIFAHTLTYNEENFVWFAVESVIAYVDKILIWDTGSTDKTIKIIEQLKKDHPKKIDFKEIGKVNAAGVTRARQQMIDQSSCDWILILDADEIWLEASIKKLIAQIKENKDQLDGLVVPFYNLIGDLWHYQDEAAGQYRLLSKKGHLQVRAINRQIPGLHLEGDYPLEAFCNKQGQKIQDSPRIKFVNAPFIHCTHLERSSKRRGYHKYKFELGNSFSKDFQFPKVLFKKKPDFVKDPWVKRSGSYQLLATFRTPLVKIKRAIQNSRQ